MKSSQDISRRALLFGRKYTEETDGATAIEYSLIAALIGVAVITGARRLGNRTKRKFNCARNAVRKGERTKVCD